jgi:hypothetical protein
MANDLDQVGEFPMDRACMPDDDPDSFEHDFPLLGSLSDPPNIRSRLHVICALYAHTPKLEARLALLDSLEALALQAAHLLAVELLESGWAPDGWSIFRRASDRENDNVRPLSRVT